MSTLILNQAQAEAVYSAMCALDKVGATILASVPVDDATWVHIEKCADTGQITLTQSLRTVARHSDQSAFAAAYGLTAANAAEQREAVQVVTEFATSARKQYAATKELTCQPDGSCQTIRVPVALLNRIRDMAELFGFPRA